MRSGSPRLHSESSSASASSTVRTGAVAAPTATTMMVTARPATGPPMATSKSILRFTVTPRDWMNAPNVGMPITGRPGIKYGHVVLRRWCQDAARWPSSCVPSMPRSASV